MAGKKSTQNRNMIIYIAIYFFTWLSGLVAFLLAKGDKSMRFHGLQSIVLGIVIVVLSFLPFIGIISLLFWLYGIYVGYEAGKGNDINMPIIGKLVKPYA